MVRTPFKQFKSTILHSSEQYRGIGPWSMTVRDRTGCCCCVGGGGATVVVVVVVVVAAAAAALGLLVFECLTAPFSLTRPVPCARPPLVRTLVGFVRVIFACVVSVWTFESTTR